MVQNRWVRRLTGMAAVDYIVDKSIDVSLDLKVAELHGLVNEVNSRAKRSTRNRHFDESITNIDHYFDLLLSSYKDAVRAVRSQDTVNVKQYVGNVGINARHVADNLNRLLQSMYIDNPDQVKEIKISKLNDNLAKAPRFVKELSDVFSDVHKWDSQSHVQHTRHNHAHGKSFTSVAVEDKKKKSGYSLANFPDVDALQWVRDITKDYLDLVKHCLYSIKDNEKERLNQDGYTNSNHHFNAFFSVLRNYATENIGKTMGAVAIASCIFTLGAIYTYQQISAEYKLISDIRDAGDILTDSQLKAYQDLYELFYNMYQKEVKEDMQRIRDEYGIPFDFGTPNNEGINPKVKKKDVQTMLRDIDAYAEKYLSEKKKAGTNSNTGTARQNNN